MEKSQKYHCILESFRKGGMIDNDVYFIASHIPIDDIISIEKSKPIKERLKNLRAGGLTEEQELRLHASLLSCISGTCNPEIFDKFYKNLKSWYESQKIT